MPKACVPCAYVHELPLDCSRVALVCTHSQTLSSKANIFASAVDMTQYRRALFTASRPQAKHGFVRTGLHADLLAAQAQLGDTGGVVQFCCIDCAYGRVYLTA